MVRGAVGASGLPGGRPWAPVARALVVTRDAADRILAPTVPIRSRIGAGDSTVAGIALALARGEPLVRAARFGVAAGAAAVMTSGTELCRREDVERLFSQMTSHSWVE
jgi:6-phosphofructokinase 2